MDVRELSSGSSFSVEGEYDGGNEIDCASCEQRKNGSAKSR